MHVISKNEVLGPFLADEDVLAIAMQHTRSTVYLAALDCNWAGKNKSGGEEDYLNIWAAVSFYEESDKVFMQGARFSTWNLEYEMKLVSSEKNLGLYRLSLQNPEEFPNEFVIRLERESGEQLYDNNNYRNYYIDHDKGHFATAVSNKSGVLYFDSIIPIKTICSIR
jgi:hypothetical protein